MKFNMLAGAVIITHWGLPMRIRSMPARRPSCENCCCAVEESSGDEVARKVDSFLQNAHSEILKDDNINAVRSYHSARQIYQQLAARGRSLDRQQLLNLFKDPALREAFGVKESDELITYRSVNGNKARSKFSPNTNVPGDDELRNDAGGAVVCILH